MKLLKCVKFTWRKIHKYYRHPFEGAFLFGGKHMLIAFEIVLMIAMLILTIGTIAEQKKEVRRDIQYILLIDTLVLTVLFLFAN